MWDNILEENVKCVLLDLDNTLYPHHVSHKFGLEAWATIVSKDLGISSQEAVAAYDTARQRTNTFLHGSASSHSRLLHSQFVTERYSVSLAYSLAWEKAYWDAFINSMTIFPRVLDFFNECKKRQLKIALVSDMTTGIQLRKLQQLKIDSYFDAIVTSEESGSEKPNPLPFLLALHKVNATAREAIMIGDSEQKDIIGAELLGIKAYLPFFS